MGVYPGYERVARYDSFVPDHLRPWHSGRISQLPFVAQAHSVGLIVFPTPLSRGTCFLEELLDEAYFLPMPTAVRRWCVVPPLFILQITAMHPANPKKVFLEFNSPNQLSNEGFVPC